MSKVPEWIDPTVVRDRLHLLHLLRKHGVVKIHLFETIIASIENSPIHREGDTVLIEIVRAVTEGKGDQRKELIVESIVNYFFKRIEESIDDITEKYALPFASEYPNLKILPRVMMVKKQLEWFESLGYEILPARKMDGLILALYHPEIKEDDAVRFRGAVRGIRDYIRKRKRRYYRDDFDIILDYYDYTYQRAVFYNSNKKHTVPTSSTNKIEVISTSIRNQHLPWR